MHHGEWMVVVAIVAIIALTRIYQAKYGIVRTGRGKEQMYVGPARGDDADAERLRGEVRQLKDRIQVLERIVTDGDHSRGLALEREIEQLRDRRREARPIGGEEVR